MKYKYDISIIIVNYNGRRYLQNLFESLEMMNLGQLSVEVVFVDNASQDSSVEFLRKLKIPQGLHLKVVENHENQGFAKGNNSGVAQSTGQYIVFLNNDTSVEKDWLINLYDCISNNDDYGIVASKLRYYYDFVELRFSTNDQICLSKRITVNGVNYEIDAKYCKNVLYGDMITCFGHTSISLPLFAHVHDLQCEFEFLKYGSGDIGYLGEESFPIQDKVKIRLPGDKIDNVKYYLIQNAGSGITEHYEGYDIGSGEKDGPQYNEKKEIECGCGASIILRKEDFLSVGGFDERFFMYYEDTDLSFAIKRLKKKIIYCPKSVVRHIHTGSSKEWSPFFTYHVFRNHLLFIYKNISKIVFWKYWIHQIIGSFRTHDKMLRKTAIDAFKILILKKECSYQD